MASTSKTAANSIGSKIQKRRYATEEMFVENEGNTDMIVEEENGGFVLDGTFFFKMYKMIKDLNEKVDRIERKINTEMVTKSEFAAQNKMLCEVKVTTKKIAGSVFRITGEVRDPVLDDIASSMPMSSVVEVLDIEEKIGDPETMQAMKTYVTKVKGIAEDVDPVIKHLFTDKLLEEYNFDGFSNKRSFQGLALVDKVLRDAYQNVGVAAFEKQVRRSLALSKNRLRQKKFAENKKK